MTLVQVVVHPPLEAQAALVTEVIIGRITLAVNAQLEPFLLLTPQDVQIASLELHPLKEAKAVPVAKLDIMCSTTIVQNALPETTV